MAVFRLFSAHDAQQIPERMIACFPRAGRLRICLTASSKAVRMRWSLNIGSVGGTAIRIHVTFLLFLVSFCAIYYRQGGVDAAWQGTLFIAILFLCVLLHELGHVFPRGITV